MAWFLWAVEDIFRWEHTLPVMLVFIAIALEVLNKMQVTLLELLFKNVREQTDLILSTVSLFFWEQLHQYLFCCGRWSIPSWDWLHIMSFQLMVKGRIACLGAVKHLLGLNLHCSKMLTEFSRAWVSLKKSFIQPCRQFEGRAKNELRPNWNYVLKSTFQNAPLWKRENC